MMNLSNLPIILYLAAIPLISHGTLGENEFLMWLGFGAILVGGVMTPGLRFVGNTVENSATNASSKYKETDND